MQGTRFGRWIVLERDRAASVKQPRWFCRCACGKSSSVRADHLRSGASQSCGCLQVEAVKRPKLTATERMAAKERHTAQRVWRHMLDRCCDARHKDYPKYGGRGIRVCDRWRDFEAYFADMWPRPAGTTMDRENNDLGYEPGNVRWANKRTQNRNQRRIRPVTFEGDTLLLTDWAERLGIKVGTLWKRLDTGWSVERTLTEPIK